MPSNRAPRFGATVLSLADGRLRRPCDRSPTVRFGSGRSPAESASPVRVPLGCGPDPRRGWHLWSHSSLRSAPRSRSRSPAVFSRRLRPRSTALLGVAGIPAALISLRLASNPPNRIHPSLSARHLSPHAASHLPCGVLLLAYSLDLDLPTWPWPSPQKIRPFDDLTLFCGDQGEDQEGRAPHGG